MKQVLVILSEEAYEAKPNKKESTHDTMYTYIKYGMALCGVQYDEITIVGGNKNIPMYDFQIWLQQTVLVRLKPFTLSFPEGE